MQLPSAARQVLEGDAAGTLVTLNEDGSPHVSPAWVGLEEDHVVTGTLPDQRKLGNIRRDPRVGPAIQTGNVNRHGLLEYLVLYGRAPGPAEGRTRRTPGRLSALVRPHVRQAPPGQLALQVEAPGPEPARLQAQAGPWSDSPVNAPASSNALRASTKSGRLFTSHAR